MSGATKHHYATGDGVLTAYSWTVESLDGSEQMTAVFIDESTGQRYIDELLAEGDVRLRAFPHEWEALLNLIIEVHAERNAVGAIISGANGVAKETRFINDGPTQ
jgi:hypothetical protein